MTQSLRARLGHSGGHRPRGVVVARRPARAMARHRAHGAGSGRCRRGVGNSQRVGSDAEHRHGSAVRRDHPGGVAVHRRDRRARRSVRPRPSLGAPGVADRAAAEPGPVGGTRAVAAARPAVVRAAAHRLRGGPHRLRARGVDPARRVPPRTGSRRAQRRGRLQRRHRLAGVHLRVGPGRRSLPRRQPRWTPSGPRCRRRSRPSSSAWPSVPSSRC